MEDMTEAELRQYVVYELDRIISELRVPMNTGLIATTLAQHLRNVVANWPDVTVHREAFAAVIANGLHP